MTASTKNAVLFPREAMLREQEEDLGLVKENIFLPLGTGISLLINKGVILFCKRHDIALDPKDNIL